MFCFVSNGPLGYDGARELPRCASYGSEVFHDPTRGAGGTWQISMIAYVDIYIYIVFLCLEEQPLVR